MQLDLRGHLLDHLPRARAETVAQEVDRPGGRPEAQGVGPRQPQSLTLTTSGRPASALSRRGVERSTTTGVPF